MSSYPAGMTVSNRALIMLSDAPTAEPGHVGHPLATPRGRSASPAGRRAPAQRRDLRRSGAGFGIGTTTVFRYLREALDCPRRAGPDPEPGDRSRPAARRSSSSTARCCGIDRVGMAAGRDRPYYSGKHKCHGMNVQVLADPAGRLIWASPALPGARHDMGAAREHGILEALDDAGVHVMADTGYQGAGPTVAVPQRRRRLDPDTGRCRRLSRNQKQVNAAHARMRGPGERANAQLKSWKILRKIRCCPTRATALVNAVQVLILAG